jgi:hypothetical protein
MLEGTPEPAEEIYEAKSFWSAMNAGFRDGEDDENDSDYDNLQYSSVRKTWDQVHSYSDQLFFGTTDQNLDLSPLHPSSIQIIRLYQIYLDNVNPLLKITHTPELQARIIEAASNPGCIGRELEALMFSIYCMAITSLVKEQCQNVFGSARDSLLTGYQFACQQALAKCEFLRTTNRDCLTALYLYLVSDAHGSANSKFAYISVSFLRCLLQIRAPCHLCSASWFALPKDSSYIPSRIIQPSACLKAR